MVIYTSFILLSFCCLAIAFNLKQRHNLFTFYFFLSLSALFLILLSGLRSYHVGTDSGTYAIKFQLFTEFNTVIDKWNNGSEAGFAFLNYLAHFFSNNYISIYILNAFIVTYCYFYGILKLSTYPALSIITLILIGPFLFHLNGARQGIALSIFFISFIFLRDKNFIKYFISILVGALFHKTILLTIPLYFLFTRKLTFKKYLIVVLCFVFLLVIFDDLISIATEIDDRYKTYGEEIDSAGGIVSSLFNFLLFCWFVICKKLNKIENKIYDLSLAIFFIGVLISLISFIMKLNPSGILRMSLYFTQFSALLIPVSIFCFKSKVIKVSFMLLFTVLMSLHFYLTTTTFSDLIPYRFNPIVTIF